MAAYRGINPLLPNGGAESAVNLHPHYQAKLEGNPALINKPASNFPASNSGTGEAAPVWDPAALIAEDQRKFFALNQDRRGNPTRFNVQNQSLPIGGQTLLLYRNKLGERRAANTQTSVNIPFEADPYATPPFRNPGPFDHARAVRSHDPEPYTFPSESIERMMRAPDEVDPALVTNPIPDPTMVARLPVFDHSAEDLATQRIRSQRTSGAMRMW